MRHGADLLIVSLRFLPPLHDRAAITHGHALAQAGAVHACQDVARARWPGRSGRAIVLADQNDATIRHRDAHIDAGTADAVQPVRLDIHLNRASHR